MKQLKLVQMEAIQGGGTKRTCLILGITTGLSIGLGALIGGPLGAIGGALYSYETAASAGCF